MPNLLGLEWESASRQEVRITLILMHGDADAFTTKVLSFQDTEAGHAQAALALQAIPLMSDAIAQKPEGSTEDYCAKVASRLPAGVATEAEVLRLLGDAVICDSTCEDYTADWVAMAIERHTATGQQRAVFGTGRQTKRYQMLYPVHENYLKQWA